MAFVSVTRLRVRSVRFLPAFIWYARLSSRQARLAPGNLSVRLRKAEGLAFWTLTMWLDEGAMRAYRSAPPHRNVMPKLRQWCDEASVAHWTQESRESPGWGVAEERMAETGRLSGVSYPSSDQQAGRRDFRR
jgi:heme-degrading monooxygenase HmoA